MSDLYAQKKEGILEISFIFLIVDLKRIKGRFVNQGYNSKKNNG